MYYYYRASLKGGPLGCEKFLPGLAWLLLSKTGPPFSASLFTSTYLKMRLQTCNHFVETNNSRRCEPLNLNEWSLNCKPQRRCINYWAGGLSSKERLGGRIRGLEPCPFERNHAISYAPPKIACSALLACLHLGTPSISLLYPSVLHTEWRDRWGQGMTREESSSGLFDKIGLRWRQY